MLKLLESERKLLLYTELDTVLWNNYFLRARRSRILVTVRKVNADLLKS